MLLSYGELARFLPYTIEGVVVAAETGKPLEKAYVYTVKGEEEALTNEQGTFSFQTWQKLPLSLTIMHPGAREQVVVVITSTPKKLRISLKQK